jgi:NADP-dependent 3-hydroxy acid dehydrogenase YdfG
VITTETPAVHADEIVSPAHASVHGLIGSMAKEYADWNVRLLDLPAAGDWPWRDLFALAGDPHGNASAYRDHRWYRQRLVPYRPAAEAAAAYRPGGVYVVIGGAGGIGAAWSEALLRRMPVQLVWIGRRPQDDAMQTRLDRLAELGPAPLYIAADATDREQLEGARETIKRELGRIDGVIHAAMVIKDHSLANMTEDEFKAGLSPKVDVCVRLAQVFGEEPLDFVLFFSSINAFVKWPGQSNYVAGCTHWPLRQREQDATEESRSGRGTPARDLESPASGMPEIMGKPRAVATEHLLAHLRLRVAATLGADPANLDSRSRPFANSLLGEFGMDSLSSNSLRNTLRQELGVDLPVQRIISEKVHSLVGALYEQLLIKHVSHELRLEDGEDSETFVF